MNIFDEIVYVIDIHSSNPELGPMPLREFLLDYISDDTTTPSGIDKKLHIRLMADGSYAIWTWGENGTHPELLHGKHESYEEALYNLLIILLSQLDTEARYILFEDINEYNSAISEYTM